MQEFKYKAFISYKHVGSSKFAENLELAVKSYAKPLWRLPVRIFRDEKYLSPGPDLWGMISEALEDSEHFIYLASPEASKAPWISDELEQWCSKPNRLDNLIIVLTHGTIAYDRITKTIDWENTDGTKMGSGLDQSLYDHKSSTDPIFSCMQFRLICYY